MNCVETQQHLSALLDRALEPGMAQTVEAHVWRCADCQAALAQLERLGGYLRSGPLHTAPDGLAERVMSAFYQARPQQQLDARGWRSWFAGAVRLPKPALPLAGVALLAALVCAFGLGRLTAARAVFTPPPVTAPPRPLLIEAPVTRERIVYVKNRARINMLPKPPASVEPSVAARQPVAPTQVSLDDFEPIKGATARVIKGGVLRGGKCLCGACHYGQRLIRHPAARAGDEAFGRTLRAGAVAIIF